MDKSHRKNITGKFSAVALAAMSLAFAACSTVPDENLNLVDAHSQYSAAANNPTTQAYASPELLQAKISLDRADRAFHDRDGREEVDHLAIEAKQRVAIANEVAQRKTAEQSASVAREQRDEARLEAHTRAADEARMNAQAAQSQAQAAQSQAMIAQQQADAAKAQAEGAQAAATQSQVRNDQLLILLKDMDAKQTDRGVVVTINDVLFDTNQADLKPGGLRNVEKLGALLQQAPNRRVQVEGFTDSTGSQATNNSLSARRAEAVRETLISQGVSGDRVTARGFGEAFPVASNDSAAGRQMNRRVEIILSDENGNVAQR